LAKWRHWNKKTAGEEWNPEGRLSEEELMNRIILTKALEVYASNQTLHLHTREGDFEVTPLVARDVMRAAKRLPVSTRKKKPAKQSKKTAK
jgi:hypothetical protein